MRPTAIRLAWNDASKTLRQMSAITTPTQRAATFLENTVDVHDVLAISCGIKASDYVARTDRPR